MKYFVAVILPRFPKNYDQCKALGLWGMTSKKPIADLVKKGDKIIFYLGQVGFVSVAEAEESARRLGGDDWKPYDQRNFPWGFKIKFLQEFEKPRHYKFPGGTNNHIGINVYDLQSGFFGIDQGQFEKITKGESADLIDAAIGKEIRAGLVAHQVRTVVGEVINYKGLVYSPVNEQGTVFLFSKLQDHLDIVIESIQQGFPDARGRIKTPKGWREVWIEFEYLSSNFVQHKHDPNGCDLIICWQHDWNNPPSNIAVIELKKILQEILAKNNSIALAEWLLAVA